ncbi:MAG: alpha-galactosidase, partial [Armatimonadota bacterium]
MAFLAWMALSAAVALGASVVTPQPAELQSVREWAASKLNSVAKAPFSFKYDGHPSTEVIGKWVSSTSTRSLDPMRTQRTVTYRDPVSGLEVRCVSVQYTNFPVVEWTLYLKNTGAADTPIIEDVQALNASFPQTGMGEFTLHHSTGSPCRADDFQPLQTALTAGSTKRISALGGRPSNSDLPYFNIQWGDGGVVLAVGWPGQWSALFSRVDAESVAVTAGQELTRFKLHPGEEVRTPLIALLAYKGDWIRGQNIWRRWMVAHNLPRPSGKLISTHFGSCWGNIQPRASEEMEQIDGWVREGIKLDYWFLDAGWYPNKGNWVHTGDWSPDTERFPRGVRELSDQAHAKGMKLVTWFEPERVTPGTWLWDKHPEWLLKSPDDSANTPQLGKVESRLLNLG